MASFAPGGWMAKCKTKAYASRSARGTRKRAQAASRARSKPRSPASPHDIRTPLTGILALAELLASSDLGERERQWANAIKSGADHLAALTTLIVDAVKADVSRPDAAPRAVLAARARRSGRPRA